jgi:4a-hydroxytetrahydrobiopterin dehydratase
MTEELSQRQCVPCEGGAEPLAGEAAQELLAQLDGWELVEGHHLFKRYSFADFAAALHFANQIGAVAEAVYHHPLICLTWGRVDLSIWTHAIDGLSENDFILAAKCDKAPA